VKRASEEARFLVYGPQGSQISVAGGEGVAKLK
jgi:hypothetical protein